jgi:hypothetical protein
MNSLRKNSRFGAAALVAASVTLGSTTGFAMPRYDGVWSVSITTAKGDCIASYRYPMRIDHGVLANGGDIAINVSGKVAANGVVKVMLSHGETHAAGSGRLDANAGAGSWKTETCSGSWTAERRS